MIKIISAVVPILKAMEPTESLENLLKINATINNRIRNLMHELSNIL